MTFTISKTKLAVAVVAVALIIPSTAMAFHVFDDVPDDKFYADPVEWAFDNGITTGKTSSTFAPDDGVTRGEAVTFLKRYNDNVVEPADEALETSIATNTSDIATNATDIAALGPMYWAVLSADGSIASRSAGVNPDTGQTRTIGTGEYEVDFTAVEDVAECHTIVSRSDASTAAVTNGEIWAEKRIGDTSSIFVATSASDGTPADSPFTLQLWCSPAEDDNIIIIALGDTGGDPDEQGND